jgi:hypothetical protein
MELINRFISHLKLKHWTEAPPAFFKQYTLRDVTTPAEQRAIEAAAAESSLSSSSCVPVPKIAKKSPPPPIATGDIRYVPSGTSV